MSKAKRADRIGQHALSRRCLSGQGASADEPTTPSRQGEKTTASRYKTRQSRTHDRTRNPFEDSTAIRRGLNCASFIEETDDVGRHGKAGLMFSSGDTFGLDGLWSVRVPKLA